MNGVDNMLYMQSTNANDGTMTLTRHLRRGDRRRHRQRLVQNRVSQAQAESAPGREATSGVTVKKSTCASR